MAQPGKQRIRVAVVFGGRSTEHAISCVSAGSVLAALDRDRYEVVPVGITLDGRWVLAGADPAALTIRDRELPSVERSAPGATSIVLPGDPTAGGLRVLGAGTAPAELGDVDVVFPVLHGAYGEDGTIQGLLELAGVPYVGAGVLGSAVAMDKEFTKKLLAAEGLPVADCVVLRPGQELSPADVERLGLPVFVKPARAGSSIGITKVKDAAELPEAIAHAREVDPKVLIEAAVIGREVECGVLESLTGGTPETSVPAEIRVVAGHDWYDFEAKYLDDVCEFDLPARLPEVVTTRLREMAARAFTALDLAGLARVDFFVGDDGTLTINEVNTMPGFTPISMFPRMWAATGLDYPALVDRLVRLALRRGTGLR
ncbi:MAG: D-alanine--D-alanine ligase [Actinobacteria bacterium]|nr:D-alanine--D-alanine ligase [Actinomycetota bacterium]